MYDRLAFISVVLLLANHQWVSDTDAYVVSPKSARSIRCSRTAFFVNKVAAQTAQERYTSFSLATSALSETTATSQESFVNSTSGTVDNVATVTRNKGGSGVWYPTRIQESMDYYNSVSRLYVRQIVTETKEMADLALAYYQQLLTNSTYEDPFGYLANTMSTQQETAVNNGTVGWVDVSPDLLGGGDASWQALPSYVLKQLYQKKPKAGDIHVIHSTSTNQYHVMQVLEVWLQLASSTTTTSPIIASADTAVEDYDDVTGSIGSFRGRYTERPRSSRLKGKGVLPQFPELTSYSVQTMGCQMNVADSERLAGILQGPSTSGGLQLSHVVDDPIKNAQLIVWNTCSIRDHAEQKLYNSIGPYAALKRNGKRLALIVTGCVAQQEGEALLKRIPELDAIVGPQYIPFMKNIIESISYGNQVVATSPMILQEDYSITSSSSGSPIVTTASTLTNNNHKPIRGHDVRAFVNVIYGCNEHCTYCVVPGTRGMEQSRSLESILAECQSLVLQGYKEITLIGQNIDAYGRDMVPKRTFAELLEFLNARLPNGEGLRLRYVTSHPRYFSTRVIDAVASLDKVCECFHMPFQAGDDNVLKRMRRGYTYESYMKIIDKIREKAPDAAITADIIVGFPGETEEAFLKTLQLMEAVKFDNINSFCYSPRPNTEAALWDDQIPGDVKEERLQRVQELAAKHGMQRSRRYVGRVEEVLVEDANPRNPEHEVMGRARQGRQVYFKGNLGEIRGKLVNVLITEARTWSLVGEMTSGQ